MKVSDRKLHSDLADHAINYRAGIRQLVRGGTTFGKTLARSFLAVTLTCFAVDAQAQQQLESSLVAAAEAEGQLTIYGSIISINAVLPGFSKKYPKIRVITATGGGNQMYNRFLTEKNAGHVFADVLWMSEDGMIYAHKAGHLFNYRPKEADNFTAKTAPKDRSYTLTSHQLFGHIYNKSAMGSLPLPKDWSDFASSPAQWKNLTSFPDPRNSASTFLVASALYQNFGPERAADIFRGLAKSGVELTSTTGVGMAKLVSGERPMVMYGPSTYVAQAQDTGAPVEFVFPVSGALFQYEVIGIVDRAPHVNAAKLFCEYVLSVEGQQLLVESRYYATRVGMPSPKGFPDVSKVRELPLDLEKALDGRDRLMDWWRSAMGAQ